jgi:hypothetical protein
MALNLIELIELDMNQPLIEPDGSPSIYFEELWNNLKTSVETINETLQDHEDRITALEP